MLRVEQAVRVSLWIINTSIILAILLITSTPMYTYAQTPAVSSTHFVIYDLAGAGQTYDQELDNYLEQAYSLYTSLGMKMAPPCNGAQYIVYVVSSLPGSETGVTEWYYTYNPSNGQIISACIRYINISAGLSTQWLEHTAYHELVHVSQAAYYQYTAIPQDYPWYIEADAEGTASYYTNQCPLAQGYFVNDQYEYDPYDYYGKPIINMYYYSAFIYWLISNGIGPATIEANVFTGDSVVNSWLDNYYVQYLLSIVHGQDLCGTTYTPTFQTISVSGNTYTFNVSLQGLSAQYYEIQLPSTGTIEVTVGGGAVSSNIQLGSAFTVSNTTLYMAIVNPSTSSESVTVTINYAPSITARVVYGTYYVLNETLSLELYVTYGTSPINGNVYVNGTMVTADNGYAEVTFTGIGWGTYTINVTYNGLSTLTSVSLQQPLISLITQPTLYLTGNSSGYLVLSIDNPNPSISIVTRVAVSSPPSPTNTYEPMIHFEPANETVLLNPGQTVTVKFYFFTNSTISSGQGYVYLYNGPTTALTLSYSVTPAQVNIVNAEYYLNGNSTIVNVYINNVGEEQLTVSGLSGLAYINYSTYTITVLRINLAPPIITLTPKVVLLAPGWAIINVTVTLTSQKCPGYPVLYRAVFSINNTYIGDVEAPCGASGYVQGVLNVTYTGQLITLTLTGTTIESTVVLTPPRISVVDYLWNVTDTYEYVYVNISVYGPYRYLVLGHEVENSSLLVTRVLPANYTALIINTGFTNVTLTRPTPSISLQSPEVTIYPQAINVSISISTPPTLAYRGSLHVYLNGSLSQVSTVNLPPNASVTVNANIKPTTPGFYLLTVALGPLSSKNITIASIELLSIEVETTPFVLVGHQEYVNVTINDVPAVELPVNVTLHGCVNKTITVMANTTLPFKFDYECALVIEVSIYTLTSRSVSYWDALNIWLGNVVGYYDGRPLILNGTVTAYATFLNGSRVPAPVLINGSSMYTPQSLGPLTLLLSVNYLGINNESEVAVFVVPPTYMEAERLLNELGNPRFLNGTIVNAITSGNWSLVNEVLSDYREASSRPYDPLAQLSRYLLVQALTRGSVDEVNMASIVLKYEVVIYIVFMVIVITALVIHRVIK
jgi:hypothetical protein